MNIDPTALIRALLWLAAAGLVVLVGARLLGTTTKKAAAGLPG